MGREDGRDFGAAQAAGSKDSVNRKQFEAKAIREAERKLQVPPGWWGTWKEVHGPAGIVVRALPGYGWSLKQNGATVSKHDSRAFAIAKGRRIAKGARR